MKSIEKIGLFLIVGFVGVIGFLLVGLFSEDTPGIPEELMQSHAPKDGDEDQTPLIESQIENDGEASPGGRSAVVREEIAPTGEGIMDSRSGMAYGRVVTEAGKPIQGVLIRIYKGGNSILPYLPAQEKLEIEDKTDSEGRYDLPNIEKGGPYKIVATHPDYAEAQFSPLKIQSGVRHEIPDIVMGRGFRIMGVVSDVAGHPIVGALVKIRDPVQAAFLEEDKQKPWKQMLTDESGAYLFENVSFKTFEVTASAEGFATQQINNNVQFEEKPQKIINFHLSPGTFIAGEVVDDKGYALEGALVEATMIHNKAFSSSASVLTADDGSFRIEGLAEGTFVVRACKKFYSDEVKREVNSGVFDLQIMMKPRGSVSGYVRDGGTNRPVSRFQIRALMVRHGRLAQTTKIVESFDTKDGYFEIKDLEPGQYVFSASAAGYADCNSAETAVVRETTIDNIEIFMNEGGELSGRVVDPSGEPVAGVSIKLNENNFQDNPLFQVFNAMGGPQGEDRDKKTLSNKDGRFHMDLIVPGTYQVALSHEDFSDKAVNDVQVLLGKGATPDLGDVVMTRGAKIEGLVRDADGKLMPGVTVSITQSNAFMRQTSTDKKGRYSFQHLVPGEYVLTIQLVQQQGKDIGNIFRRLMIADQSKITVFLEEGMDKEADIRLIE